MSELEHLRVGVRRVRQILSNWGDLGRAHEHGCGNARPCEACELESILDDLVKRELGELLDEAPDEIAARWSEEGPALWEAWRGAPDQLRLDEPAAAAFYARSRQLLPRLLVDFQSTRDDLVAEKVEHAHACVMGKACYQHQVVHGREAEDLRAGIEKVLDQHGPSRDGEVDVAAYDGLRRSLRDLLERVDARDSLAFLVKAGDDDDEAPTCS